MSTLFLLPFPSVDTFPVFNLSCASFLLVHDRLANAHGLRAMGAMTLGQKKEELESKSSHESDM